MKIPSFDQFVANHKIFRNGVPYRNREAPVRNRLAVRSNEVFYGVGKEVRCGSLTDSLSYKVSINSTFERKIIKKA